jgi:haloalkane dehalogenase
VFARDLVGAHDWYASLWARRNALADRPALLLWGEKDPGFDMNACRRWERLFETVDVHTVPEAGHLPQEEAPAEVSAAVRPFVRDAAARTA